MLVVWRVGNLDGPGDGAEMAVYQVQSAAE